jgi:hypothetical protein
MTLVARFLKRNVPFIVGDLLVSKPSWQDVNSNMPTIPRRAQAMVGVNLGSQDWAASELVQKVILLNDRVVVGWAGKMSVAREVLGRLRNDLANVESQSHLDSVLDRISATELREISLLGFALIGDALYSFDRGPGIASFQSTRFQQLTLTGTGIESFLRLKDLERTYELHTSEPNPGTRAVIDVVQVVGNLIATEMLTLETLLANYGAGFEIAFLSHDKFEKFDEMLYTVWQATFVGEEVSVDFLHMFKYAYAHEDLAIRVADIDLKSNHVADTKFCIPPVDSKKPRPELLAICRPEFPSKLVTLLVLVADVEAYPKGSFSLFVCQPDLDKLRVEYPVVGSVSGSVLVEMDEALLEAVREMARRGREAGHF